MASGPRPKLSAGTNIRGTYEVESWLGAGAYGNVYRVRHRFLGVQALKLIDVGPDAPPVEELLNEARVLAQLSHVNVVRLFDADIYKTDDGARPFLTMEYLPHGTLGSLMNQRIRFDPGEAFRATRQVLLGLDAAHSLDPPVLHRDVTPGNVLVGATEPLTLKLSDFGLAAHVHPETRLLRAAGTIRYQPPEASWGYATEASDLYAVALILYEMLTGMPAFPVDVRADLGTSVGVADALRRSREATPAPPSRFRPNLPPGTDELLVSALAPRPEDRFGSARGFADTVEAVLVAARIDLA